MQDLNYHTLPPFPLTPSPNFLLHLLIPLFAYHTTYKHMHKLSSNYGYSRSGNFRHLKYFVSDLQRSKLDARKIFNADVTK